LHLYAVKNIHILETATPEAVIFTIITRHVSTRAYIHIVYLAKNRAEVNSM